MDRFNIIDYLRKKTDSREGRLFEEFINDLEITLMCVDDFEGTIFFDIYEYIYLTEEYLTQEEISDELEISQSKISKNLKKIDAYIYKLLSKKKYTSLLRIIDKK